tara:strand:+ start:2613 stop:2747 length:135 start_codon:yes stop_codon:yes gene_type:complete
MELQNSDKKREGKKSKKNYENGIEMSQKIHIGKARGNLEIKRKS